MANRPSTKTNTLLLLFLISVSAFVFAALYVDALNKNHQLHKQVRELEQNQVLLMVPDAQAEAIAQWLATNPKQTLALLDQAKAGEQTSVEIGPNSSRGVHTDTVTLQSAPPLLVNKNTNHEVGEIASGNGPALKQTKRDDVPKLVPEVVSEGKDNVKVISLPHGGIRVTTRENN